MDVNCHPIAGGDVSDYIIPLASLRLNRELRIVILGARINLKRNAA